MCAGCTFNILVFQRSADEHLPALLQDVCFTL
jgi:hypothetical protein